MTDLPYIYSAHTCISCTSDLHFICFICYCNILTIFCFNNSFALRSLTFPYVNQLWRYYSTCICFSNSNITCQHILWMHWFMLFYLAICWTILENKNYFFLHSSDLYIWLGSYKPTSLHDNIYTIRKYSSDCLMA